MSNPAERHRRFPRMFLIGCCILLFVVESIGVLMVRNKKHQTDFRVYYAAGYMLRKEPAALYDFNQQVQEQDSLGYNSGDLTLYLHPSYEALLFEPFTFLPYHAAYLIYVAFSTLLLLAIFRAAPGYFSTKIPWVQSHAGQMMLLWLPLSYSILWGQDSVLFLLLCCLTWRQLQQEKNLSAGAILALGLFRFQLAIPIAIIVAVRRGRRFTIGFLTTSAAIVLLCIALVGKAGMAALYRMLTAAALLQDQSFQARRHMGISPRVMPNLAGLFYAAGTRFMPAHAAFIVIALASLGVFIWTLFYVRRQPLDVVFAMAILCSILLSYHMYVYDLTLLVLPMALLARRIPHVFLAIFYALPLVIGVIGGFRWFFLLAIPVLTLLACAGTSRWHWFGMANDQALETPLYTR